MTDDAPRKRPPGPGRGHKIKQGNGFDFKPAAGAGWGGPAKGDGPQPLLTREEKIRRSNEMADVIYKVATNEQEYGSVRIQAAGRLYEMYNGKPIERVIVDEQPIVHDVIDPADLSVEAREELRAALEAQKLSDKDNSVH